FLIGVSLGALGGGGSILAVPALVYVAGEGAKAATTVSLVVVGTTALAGMVGHWRAGRVRPVAGLMLAGTGIAGSIFGSKLNASVDPDVLLLGFSGLMLLAAWRMQRESRRVRTDSSAGGDAGEVQDDDGGGAVAVAVRPRVDTALVARVVVAGTVVGFLTGFFGVGGGFVIVPALVLALGFEMPVAVGTSLLVIAANSAIALWTRVATVGVEWHVAIPFTIAGLLGASFGAKLAGRVDGRALARAFAILLVVLAAYTATRSLLALT
ncbi:MAG TPA: sulfite exporter TauE/SafE family protein, partial [Acidimicrobiales bacterium]|nr:sulfite exporter TauE/SafE family protein [Acidimicrobiales bacterium]